MCNVKEKIGLSVMKLRKYKFALKRGSQTGNGPKHCKMIKKIDQITILFYIPFNTNRYHKIHELIIEEKSIQ